MAVRLFPSGFRWGTATAAHQVEGNNWANDWWAWEHAPATVCREPSGDACDHYHRYPDDIAMLADLGFNSYRFSVEWSRIEPEDGEFSRASLDHYRRMAACCHESGIDAVISLHHFTSPRWFASAGGWVADDAPALFTRFVERVAGHLGDLATRWCTFNEPNMVATLGHLAGRFPPGLRDRGMRHRANDMFVAAHRAAIPVLKSASAAPVGLTLAMQQMWPVDAEGEERSAHYLAGLEDPYLEAARDDDYIGVQTYSRERVGADGVLPPEEGVETTIMGYEFWPESLEHTIRRAWAETNHTPILVTENGIAATDDTRRIEYVRRALGGVLACLEDGIDVRGYTYWSLLDNFEWTFGYAPTFGLVAVDRVTQGRTVKPSARWLGAIAQANAMES
jgi:beta-glucosidase